MASMAMFNNQRVYIYIYIHTYIHMYIHYITIYYLWQCDLVSPETRCFSQETSCIFHARLEDSPAIITVATCS